MSTYQFAFLVTFIGMRTMTPTTPASLSHYGLGLLIDLLGAWIVASVVAAVLA